MSTSPFTQPMTETARAPRIAAIDVLRGVAILTMVIYHLSWDLMFYGWVDWPVEYGLGWRIYDYAGHTMIYHAGAVEGYRAQIGIFPDLGVGIAAMWNSESSKAWGIVPVFADALYGLPGEDWMKLQRGGTGQAGD